MKKQLRKIIGPFLKSRESRLTLEAMDDYDAEEFLNHIRSNVMMGVLPLDAIANHGDLIAEEFGDYTGCEIEYEDDGLGDYVPTRGGGIELLNRDN
jgi:hypothetical protein